MGQKLGKGRKGKKEKKVEEEGGGRVYWTDEEEMEKEWSREQQVEQVRVQGGLDDMLPSLRLNAVGWTLQQRDVFVVMTNFLSVKDLLALRRASKGLLDMCNDVLAAKRGVFVKLQVVTGRMVPEGGLLKMPTFATRLRHLRLHNDSWGNNASLDQLNQWLKATAEIPLTSIEINDTHGFGYSGLMDRKLVLSIFERSRLELLERLELYCLDDASFKAIALDKLPKLTSLSLQRTFHAKNGSDAFVLIKVPPALTSLRMDRLSLPAVHHNEFVGRLGHLQQFDMVDMTGRELEYAHGALLAKIILQCNLKKLSWRYYVREEDGFDASILHEKDFSLLETLSHYGSSTFLKPFLASSNNLRVLVWNTLEGSTASSMCLAALAKACPLLEELTIGRHGSQIPAKEPWPQEDSFDAVEKWNHLRVLVIGADILLPEFIRALTIAQPPLTRLVLKNDAALLPDIHRLLQQSACLQHITLSESGGETLDALSNCPELQDVALYGTGEVKDENVLRLVKGCPKMTFLQCWKWEEVTDVGWLAMARGWPRMMSFMADGATQMTDAAVVEMARRWPELCDLNLNYNTRLTNASLRALHFYSRKLQEMRAGGTTFFFPSSNAFFF